MDAKLEAHRAQKRRQELFDKYKKILWNMVSFQNSTAIDIDGKKNDDDHQEDDDRAGSEDELLQKNKKPKPIDEDDDNGIVVVTSGEEELLPWSSEDEVEVKTPIAEPDPSQSNAMRYLTWFLYFCFWATCYLIAIELQFGMVFLLFSALFGIYFNTRTGPRRRQEVSAYSVFNENCKAIDGTLNAEQFEREIRYGPTSVH